MATSSLPQSVHQWVKDNLARSTEANKNAVLQEMRSVISKAYQDQTLNTIDWPNYKLQSLATPSLTTFPSPLGKRKSQDDTPSTFGPNKRFQFNNTKSNSTSKSNASYNVFQQQDDAIRRREERFAREHQIEKARQIGALSSDNSTNGATQWAPNSLVRRLGAGPHHKKPWAIAEPEPVHDPNVIDWDRYTIVGRSTALFKNYLRLTSEPDPKDIRPLPVLQETFTELKRRWRSESNYPWICDQFKSLRQDLTVQRIKNEFTVSVYEVHARIALESSDLVEFNACQATLRQLYGHGLRGKNDEFLAYRILYLLHGRNRAELNMLVSELTSQEKATPEVRHAIAVHMAMATGNYHKFFVLYSKAPNMGGYIMDHYSDRERCAALITMGKAYRTLPVSYLLKEFGYEENELPKLIKFLADHAASIFTNPNAHERELIVDLKSALPGVLQAQAAKYTKVGIRGQV